MFMAEQKHGSSNPMHVISVEETESGLKKSYAKSSKEPVAKPKPECLDDTLEFIS